MSTSFRLAVRTLAKSPGFATVAVLTLALGIGAITAIFSVAYGVLKRPLSYREPESLVLVDGTRRFAGKQRPQTFSGLEIPDWQRARSLASLAGYADIALALDTHDMVEPVTGTLVSETFFATLGAPPMAGRLLVPGDDLSPVAVISHRLWLRIFDGRADAVGTAITLGDHAYTIVGIAAPNFRFPSDRVDVWTPMGEAKQSGLAPWLNSPRGGGVQFVARLKPGVTVAQARSELLALGHKLGVERGETNQPLEPVVTTVADAAAAGVGPALRLLLGAVALLLLVAAANVSSLMLARYAARRRDIAVRLALGASRGQLMAHAMTESALLGAAGCISGVLLAVAIVRTLIWWGPTQLPRLDAIRVDAPVLAFAVAVGIIATILSSLGPALQSVHQDAAADLRANGRIVGAARAGKVRALLVGTQLAVAVLLLVGTSVLMRSFVRLSQVDFGARTDNVLVARLDLSLGRTLDEAQQRALGMALVARSRALPGVETAGLGTALPPNGRMVQLTLKNVAVGRAVISEYAATAAPVTAGFFAALGVPLLEGRFFDDGDDAAHARVLIVSADVAHDLFGGHAIGQKLSLPTPKGAAATATVVGVVGNVKYGGLARPVEPTLYVPFTQQPWRTAFLVARTSVEPALMAPSLRQAIGSVDRRIGVVSIRPLADILAQETAQPAFRTAVLCVVTGAAVALAAIGLAGVVAYSVSRRTAEIGVRMTLGAGPRQVAWMVLREAVWLAAAGAAAGLVAAAAGTRLLTGFVFGVTPGDPASFAVAAAFFTVVILAASAGPAWRASRVDPIVALRAE